MAAKRADVAIIGSGQGAVPLATALADDGQDVVIFERDQWGGTCVNYGCIPSKTFLASAHAAANAHHAAALGVRATVTVDFPAIMERVQKTLQPSRRGVKRGLEAAGVQTVEAEARVVEPNRVIGGDATVEAPTIVLNTGKSPLVPPISGLRQTPYMTYVDFWRMRALPPRLLVIGAGYTGLELGQGMARLGSEVQIVEKDERAVAGEEEAVSRALEKGLREDGVEFHFGRQAVEVSHAGNIFQLTLDDGRTLSGEGLLVAAGRKPNTAGLGLEATNVSLDDDGHVIVDQHLETTSRGIFAIGDVTGQPAFTHVSWEDHRRLLGLWRGEERWQRDRILAYAFFTEPQVGRAGLTLEQARALDYDAEAVTLELENVTRTAMNARKPGFYCMVVNRDNDLILGATLVGESAAELIHVFVAHMMAGAPWQVLERSVHIHPTYAEALPTLARQLQSDA